MVALKAGADDGATALPPFLPGMSRILWRSVEQSGMKDLPVGTMMSYHLTGAVF